MYSKHSIINSQLKFSFLTLALAAAISPITLAEGSKQLEEVRVVADFKESDIYNSANSLSVADAATIARRDARHLEQILATAPNVNFASGASRGRFLQIRGIGERSQFKDPLDTSVGMIIDGIDYSGIGLAGVLFDVEQVDILRGPQGTQFGASAMAGLVNIHSAKPTENFAGKVTAGVGNYDTYHAGAMINGALNDSVVGRIAVSSNRSDGFIDNDFLNRDDTNNIDEKAVNARLGWTVNNDLTLNIVGHYLDADNGYNAFSLDNNREIPADDPGHDRQRSRAIAINGVWQGMNAADLQATLTAENSELAYGFDWDWSNLDAAFWRGWEDNKRARDTYTIDLRLTSKDDNTVLGGASWVAGIYAYQRDEDFYYTDYYDGFTYLGPFNSTFEQTRTAVYGQLQWSLTDHVELATGLRGETYKNDYQDSAALTTDDKDTLWGGDITLSYGGFENTLVYATLSRGYKAGGVNVETALVNGSDTSDVVGFLQDRQTFAAETLLNYEVGFKGRYLQNTLGVATSLFYMDRQDMQAKSYVLFPPAKWVGYLDNVNGGYNAGVEIQLEWLATDWMTVFASMGYLDTELGDLVVPDVVTDEPLDQTGREQAHAPNYQFNLGANLILSSHLSLNLEVDGKDAFYFSNSHNVKSDSYELFHAALTYDVAPLSVRLWGRNLTDKDYQTRGFYFDNTGSGAEPYYQLGEPRTFGVTATYSF